MKLRIDLHTTCHATESEEKVTRAVLNLIPPSIRSKVKVKKLQAKGYYGNPITRITVSIRGEQALETLRYILSSMDSSDRRLLLLSLPSRTDKYGNVYIRLSKQDAVLGKPTVFDGDDIIKVVLHTGFHSISDVKKFLETMLGEERS